MPITRLDGVEVHRSPACTQDWMPSETSQLLTSRGDGVTVQLAQRAPPPDALLYVERRVAFEVQRREPWPGGRVLLTLAAWSRR
jgi:hypothetical protein